MLVSERVYCVVVAFKMTEWVEQWTCIRFCIKLEHSFAGIIDHSEGHSYGQLMIGSFITTTRLLMHHFPYRVFCQNIKSNHPGDSAPLQPRFGALWLLACPKIEIAFEREEISDHQWDSGKHDGAADSNSNEIFCRVFWTVEEMLGEPVSYTHLTLPTTNVACRSRWSPYH